MNSTIGSIDLYCERVEAAFWAEPVNALTNASFLVAAYLLWKLLKQESCKAHHLEIGVFLCASIGVGSFLFHTYATPWSRWLDVLPILLFQIYFIGAYLALIVKFESKTVLLILSLYLVIAITARQFSEILNGSMIYAPAIVGLATLALWHLRNQHNNKWTLLIALAVFIGAVFFRTIDNEICELFPLGTHFLWHLLNGLLVYLLGYSLIANSEHGRKT